MGRQKVGDLIRKCNFVNVKDQNEVGKTLGALEEKCKGKDKVTLAELKDIYAAIQEKVCVRNFGYRHSPAFWSALSAIFVLKRLKEGLDDWSESTVHEYGRLDVYTWLALVQAGPNSAHLELMQKFDNKNSKQFLKTCDKTEIARILGMMKITFSYDTGDTDLDERHYGSTLNDELVKIFEYIGGEKLKEAQAEYVDLYFHYWKQVPHLKGEKLIMFTGRIVANMAKHLEWTDDEGDKVKNPYMNLKIEAVLRTHIEVLNKQLAEYEGDIRHQEFEDILKLIIRAALNDKLIDKLFDCFLDLIVNFVRRDTLPKNSDEILSCYQYTMFRNMKILPTPAMCDASLKSAKALATVAAKRDKLEKDLFGLIQTILMKGFASVTKITADQIRFVLEFVNQLLASGHQQLITLADSLLTKDVVDKNLNWKKYLDEAKAIFKTVSQLPIDKLRPEKPRDDQETVLRSIDDFMRRLLDNLKESKVLPKLTTEIVTYAFECMECSPPAKSRLASYAAGKFKIQKSDPPELIETTLAGILKLIKNEDITWDTSMNHVVQDLMIACIKSFDGNGGDVTPKQHKLFMAVIMTCLAGDDIDDTFYPPGQQKTGGVKFSVYNVIVIRYMGMHMELNTQSCCVPMLPEVLKWAKLAEEEENEDIKRQSLAPLMMFSVKLSKNIAHMESDTQSCCVPMLPEVLKWAKLAEEEENEDIKRQSLALLMMFSVKPPEGMAASLKQIMDLFVNPENMKDLSSVVTQLYPLNPHAVHERLYHLWGMLDTKMKDSKKSTILEVFTTVAQIHPEAIKEDQVKKLLDKCKGAKLEQQMAYLNIMYLVARRRPQTLQKFFPQLLDDGSFNVQALSMRAVLITQAGAQNKQHGQQAVDFNMKLATHDDSNMATLGLGQLAYLVKDHKDYMQKHKPALQKIEKSTTFPEVKQSCGSIIQVLQGKNYQDVFQDLYKEIQEQQELTAELDKKLDHTMNTVVTMGEHVTEHHKDLKKVKHDIGDLEEKVEDIDEDLGQTKIKVEEIDNKTMTNAPKWSRDLTKLMNPKHACDWRMLASRLGYSNDDIRAWAQQHDPCMAVLSEWYATHKTSEANHAVLTHLTEMNRLDGAAIVENAMKASEGVVEDEEFEYPSPPPIFLSYQWGMQNEVKLLKQHLNMAGYECWMDIGQMGGGDKLFAKIDNGIRAAKVIICCVTDKYSQSPNCNREVNLSVNLGKPMIPLLMERMNWPPKGAMGPIFSEYLFIRFFQRAGEETTDNRYWPVPKFEELLMQLNYSVPPDESKITKEYNKWWVPIVEDIVIDKNKGKSGTVAQSASGQTGSSSDESPLVFLSYQWGKQPQVKALYQRICSLGYTVWMDIFQMGGGDSLYDKIDRGVRGCKVVVTCVTPKYALSANCRREVSLADALKKPIVPLLLEQMKWPPDGPMSMVFTELLYIQVYRDPDIQVRWTGEKFDELAMKLQQYVGGVPEVTDASQEKTSGSQTKQEKSTVAQAKQEKSGGAQTKSKPGGAAQSKFVESKKTVDKPPAKEDSHNAEKSSQSPKANLAKDSKSAVVKPTGKASQKSNVDSQMQESTTTRSGQDSSKATLDSDKPKSKSCSIL